MITHRLETQPLPEPPSRFYKLVAVLFLIITVALLGVVTMITAKKAVITITARADAKPLSLTARVAPSPAPAGMLVGTVTTTRWRWSEKFYPTGTKTVPGVATGVATIYNKSGTDQPLVKTTRLLTPAGVLFRLSQGTVVPANGSVEVPVYADAEGEAFNIGPSQFAIPGLNSARQALVYAASARPMTGGVKSLGALSAGDLEAARESYRIRAAAAFQASVSTTLAGQTVLVALSPASSPRASAEAGAEVSEFTLSGVNEVVLISFKPQELTDFIQSEAARLAGASGEKILSVGQPTVKLLSFDNARGTAELAVAVEARVSLDPNAPALAAANFFGQSKDAIERALYALPHLSSVTVKFSPRWLRSAPGIPEKIKIVVKQVE